MVSESGALALTLVSGAFGWVHAVFCFLLDRAGEERNIPSPRVTGVSAMPHPNAWEGSWEDKSWPQWLRGRCFNLLLQKEFGEQ